MRSTLALALACILVCLAACSPRIGDSCSSSVNCSINGDRLCDTTQPNGACVVFDCQADQCPDDAVCARFNPAEPRLSVLACMRRCSSDSDCRSGDGYRCIDPSTFEDGLFAEVVDLGRPDARFCVAVAAP
jgi:curli biogenesis system outer membrane secretion channel CsgG